MLGAEVRTLLNVDGTPVCNVSFDLSAMQLAVCARIVDAVRITRFRGDSLSTDDVIAWIFNDPTGIYYGHRGIYRLTHGSVSGTREGSTRIELPVDSLPRSPDIFDDGFVPKPVIEADLLAAIGACLGLQWRRAATGGPDDEPEPAAPSGDAVRELLALSAGGYPRALRARLAELAQESAATAAWVARIASLLESDPGALNAALGQALREPARG